MNGGFARRVRALLLGPSDEEISAMSQAAGGPPYPIPPFDMRPPTDEPAQPEQPPDPDRGDTVPDDTRTMTADAPDTDTADTGEIPTHPDTPTSDPVTDSGVHAVTPGDPNMPLLHASCPTCHGAGYVRRGVNELLRESVSLIPVDQGDQVIREFYRRLLHAAPHLAPLFPKDLLTAATQDGASPGAMQRDKLLHAVIEVAELYGGSPDDMSRLVTCLESYGRAHAAFARPGGGVRGATLDEYVAVREVFLGTLAELLGERWLDVYTAAWTEAINFTVVVMLHAQYFHGMSAPRYPRRDADHE